MFETIKEIYSKECANELKDIYLMKIASVDPIEEARIAVFSAIGLIKQNHDGKYINEYFAWSLAERWEKYFLAAKESNNLQFLFNRLCDKNISNFIGAVGECVAIYFFSKILSCQECKLHQKKGADLSVILQSIQISVEVVSIKTQMPFKSEILNNNLHPDEQITTTTFFLDDSKKLRETVKKKSKQFINPHSAPLRKVKRSGLIYFAGV